MCPTLWAIFFMHCIPSTKRGHASKWKSSMLKFVMVATREYQTCFTDGRRVCSSLMVMILWGAEWEALNFRLKDGDIEWNPLSWNHVWRTTVFSIVGFTKIVVLEIVPTVFPLKSVTWMPLIAIAGGVGKPWRLESLAYSIWKCSSQSVM